MSILETLVASIAPHDCLSCGVEGELLCGSCIKTRLCPAEQRCYRCHSPSPDWQTCPDCQKDANLTQVLVGTRYEGVAQALIHRLKFDRAGAGAEVVGDYLSTLLPLIDDRIIVHVPTATSRVRQRGYDQALLIASALARATRMQHVTALRRVGQLRQLGARRRQRLQQLEAAYEIRDAAGVAGRRILLVDDVITTGATLEAAAKCLRQAGAASVSAIVFAQKQ